MSTVQGTVRVPSAISLGAGTSYTLVLGKNGDLLASAMHGKYAAAARSGNLFLGSTLAAGIAVPFNATTLASKFTLWNPASSGVDIELVELGMGLDSATVIVNSIAMGFQTNLSSTTGIPTSLTASAAGVTSTFLGSGGTAKAGLYTAATLTNAAVLGPLLIMFEAGATAVTNTQSLVYNFDGKIWLPPDSLCTLVTTVTGGETAAPFSLIWGEWTH